jgi:hypothetical protein
MVSEPGYFLEILRILFRKEDKSSNPNMPKEVQASVLSD